MDRISPSTCFFHRSKNPNFYLLAALADDKLNEQVNNQQINNKDLATVDLIYFNSLVFSQAHVLVVVIFIMLVNRVVIFLKIVSFLDDGMKYIKISS